VSANHLSISGRLTDGTFGWQTEQLEAIGAGRLADLYTSESILDLERRRIFGREWILVASIEDFPPGPGGGCLPVDIVGWQILLIRTASGELKGFHNICPHRGLPLVEDSGQCGRFLTCPYHQWSFTVDGRLANAPQPDQFDREDLAVIGLTPVEVVNWHGFIFARIDGTEPFDASIGELDERVEPFFAGPLVKVADVTREVACNWKFMVENHVDVYHLWYLHSKTLNTYDHFKFEWQRTGKGWWSFEPPKRQRKEAPLLSWLDEDLANGVGAHLIYPNSLFITSGSNIAIYNLMPLAPDRSLLKLRVRSVDGVNVDAMLEAMFPFLEEDIWACERLQIGVRSPWFSVGPLAGHHELPLYLFHEELRNNLLELS
jgi:choline monooxygenase